MEIKGDAVILKSVIILCGILNASICFAKPVGYNLTSVTQVFFINLKVII